MNRSGLVSNVAYVISKMFVVPRIAGFSEPLPTFEFATQLVKQEASVDAVPSAELLSVNDALVTAQTEIKEAEEHLALLQ